MHHTTRSHAQTLTARTTPVALATGVVERNIDIARAWVDGWVLSRGTDMPISEAWGLRIEVGAPNQIRRHVLLDADETTIRTLTTSVTEPMTWIKAFVQPNVLKDLLPQPWKQDSPAFLMATELSPTEPHVPHGYQVQVSTSHGLTHVRVRAGDGSAAAQGQVAVTGRTCVFDQIVTEVAHQRRGLGTAVMATLTSAALDQNARTGILGATLQGRALYECLGWHVAAPLAGFVYEPSER